MTNDTRGLIWGLIGVLSFSLTLPATRAAVPEMGVGFVMFGRAIAAAVLAGLCLIATRQRRPTAAEWQRLTLVVAGVVIGFPFLTSYAMSLVPSSHGAVVVGLLPLSTAIASVILNGERPSLGFWLASLAGTVAILAFVLLGSNNGGIGPGDWALLGAVIAAAIGYAVGGQLSSALGGWQVISWALVMSLPLLLLGAPLFATWPTGAVSASAWLGFGYITIVSQFLGFFAWYHGLGIGGVARVSQVQLLQLFFTLIASAALLGERLEPKTVLFGFAVVTIVAIGTRLRVRRTETVSAP